MCIRTSTEILILFLFPTTDWNAKVRRLNHVSSGVNQSNIQLECTASDVTGPTMAWRVYQPKCSLWRNLRNETGNGVRIEKRAVSSCVATSTLTILNYQERGYEGSVIVCSTSRPGSPENHSANFTILGRFAFEFDSIQSAVVDNCGHRDSMMMTPKTVDHSRRSKTICYRYYNLT